MDNSTKKWMWLGWLLLAFAIVVLPGCGGNRAGTCRPKERGCACVQDACNDGLLCQAGTCQPQAVSGLSVSSGDARACEVLLGDGDVKIDHVEFGDHVTGRWLRQGDKVAVAFIANQDAPIGGNAMDVAYASGGSSPFTVLASHCYGQKGEELPGVAVHR
jgi:hypothetical protein